MYLRPIVGTSNIISRPTNVRQRLKSLNRFKVTHTVAPSQDNTCIIGLKKHGPEHLVAYG
jgi:hypothetical protein